MSAMKLITPNPHLLVDITNHKMGSLVRSGWGLMRCVAIQLQQ